MKHGDIIGQLIEASVSREYHVILKSYDYQVSIMWQ